MTAARLPLDSDALRANIAGTAQAPVIPDRFQPILEAVADSYGARELVRETLEEYFHRYRNAATVIDGLQTLLLRDWAYFERADNRALLFSLFLEVMEGLLRDDLAEERTSQLVRQLLIWGKGAVSGRFAGDYLEPLGEMAELLHRLYRRLEAALLERDKPLRELTEAALAYAGQPGAAPRAEEIAHRLAGVYRRVLLRGYSIVAERLDVTGWAVSREARLRSPKEVADLFESASTDEMRKNLTRAAQVQPGDIIASGLPTFNQLLEDVVQKLFRIPVLEDRFAVCLFLLKDTSLGLRQREVMVELLSVVRDLIRPSRVVHFHRILRRLARFFQERAGLFPEMRFQCYEAIGVAIGEAGAVGAADRLTNDLLSWRFEYADVSGATDEWRTTSNRYHLPNIRCWMRIISSNPPLFERLAAGLTVQLRLGGAFVADTDLFQKDITDLLNARIEPVYPVIKQLLRCFPVYFNEVGAEGELRSVSTDIDELSGRKDSLMHFLRKQVHAESSNRLVNFSSAVLQYWSTLDPEPLKPYLSPRAFADVSSEREQAAGPHNVLANLPATTADYRKVELMRRMRELLIEKYSLAPRNLGPLVSKFLALPLETREAFASSLLTWQATYRGPQRGIMAAITQYSRSRAREALLGHSLRVLAGLKEIILNRSRSEGQENIFHKRHIAAGIPSMYGTYHEAKFDALGLSFRVEGLVSQMLEEIAAEITDQYVSRASLRRFAHNLECFRLALDVDGIRSQNFNANLVMLRDGANHAGFSFNQCRNVFQFLASDIGNLARLTTQGYDDALQLITSRDSRPQNRLLLERDALAEELLREILVSTLGLQSLDRYISNALSHLTELGERVGSRDLTRMMNYDPDRLVSWLDVPQPQVDDQMTLGYKALGLKKMMEYGYRVPEGFVLTTELFSVFPAMSHRPLYEHTVARIRHALSQLEEKTGMRLGDPKRPLTLAIRSGAAISMPGLMATITNVGLNDDLAEAFARQPGMAWTAWDSYRRFLQSWAMTAGIDRDVFDEIIARHKGRYGLVQKLEFTPEQMREIALDYRARCQELGVVLIDDPLLQVVAAVGRVLASWYSPQARFYRRYMGVADEWGTAVIIQRMIYGNRGRKSGAGVTFTRSLVEPRSGQVRLFGDFAIGVQGEDLVGGLVNPLPMSEAQRRASATYRGVHHSLENDFPDIYSVLLDVAQDLVSNREHDPQEIEFGFESPAAEDVYLLQKRSMVQETAEVVMAFALMPDGKPPKADAVGMGVSGSAYVGRVAVNADQIDALTAEYPEDNILLLRPDTVPEEIAMIVRVQGILTARGGATSHAAVTAKRLRKNAVVDCRGLEVNEAAGIARLNGHELKAGDWLSIDGRTGHIFFGKREVVSTTKQVNRG